MELKRQGIWMMAASISLLVACDGNREQSLAAPPPVLVDLVESAAASVERLSEVTVPNGTEIWLVAAPYCLEEGWSNLGLSLSQEDKDRLIEANVANENVLVACIANNRVVQIATLGPRFAVSPSVFTAYAGDKLVLQRRDEPRSLLIVRSNP